MEKPDSSKSKSTKDVENCLDYYEIRIKRSLREPKFVLEVAGFVVLAIYAGFTIAMYFANRAAAHAATSAANTAASELELSERPWVAANITLNGPLTFDANNATIPLTVIMRNTDTPRHSPLM